MPLLDSVTGKIDGKLILLCKWVLGRFYAQHLPFVDVCHLLILLCVRRQECEGKQE